jgi:hypothetical protein
VAAGAQDNYIRSWAAAAKSWGQPLFLRYAWEMNAPWFSWGSGANGTTGADYVAAWRHVHDIFQSVGATNVKWVWCPNIDPGGKFADLADVSAGRGDIIVMLDAEGSTDPAEIPFFVDALVCGADLAKGSRFMDGGQSIDITFTRRPGNRVLSGIVNLLFGTSHTDLCYGYTAFWARCLPVLDVDCDGFEIETQIQVRAAQAKLRVVEVPSLEHERLHGRSKLRAWRDSCRVLATILRERLRRGSTRLEEAVVSG